MATTRFPADQNPAVDLELPQPAGQQRITTNDPAPVSPLQTGDGTSFPPVANVDITQQPAPVDPIVDRGNGSSYNPTNAATPSANSFAAGAGTFEGGEAEYLAQVARERAHIQAALQARFGSAANGDWRVKLQLAKEADYLYNSNDPGILAPLKASDGVVFPYMPSIQTTYNANYDSVDLTHSNYRGQFYKSSNVGDIQITGIFTAQDTVEANYMLAVIHFFKSATKMFYGQDAERGAPPPLVYLIGLGQYQFSNHPCVIKSFSYNLPTDVDYIRTQPNNYGVNLLNRRAKTVSAPSNTFASVFNRLGNALDKLGNPLKRGALPAVPAPGQVSQQSVNNTSNATYVPTKIEIQLTLMPIQTRSQQSQQFSVKGFANGDLLKDGFW
jgi:hypothetical protein